VSVGDTPIQELSLRTLAQTALTTASATSVRGIATIAGVSAADTHARAETEG
jgi:hypothetical protein